MKITGGTLSVKETLDLSDAPRASGEKSEPDKDLFRRKISNGAESGSRHSLCCGRTGTHPRRARPWRWKKVRIVSCWSLP